MLLSGPIPIGAERIRVPKTAVKLHVAGLAHRHVLGRVEISLRMKGQLVAATTPAAAFSLCQRARLQKEVHGLPATYALRPRKAVIGANRRPAPV